MEVSHTPVDKPTARDVWTALEELPQRVSALLKKYESLNDCRFEEFERELHSLFAQTECAVTEEALARHDVDLPYVFIDGDEYRRACRCAQTYLTAAGAVSVTRDDMNEATPVIEIAQNTLGRDFVVGDIHGCFSTVEHALAALDCDLSRDRLFSVGDLIDHGARSNEALAWISGSVLHFEAQEHRTSNEAAPRTDEACTGRGRRAGFPGARASCPHGRSWPIRSRRSAVAEHGWARSFTLKIRFRLWHRAVPVRRCPRRGRK